MGDRSKVRLVLSQPEVEVVKYAATQLEQSPTSGLNGHQVNALARALDKLALALAAARGRDADRGVR